MELEWRRHLGEAADGRRPSQREGAWGGAGSGEPGAGRPSGVGGNRARHRHTGSLGWLRRGGRWGADGFGRVEGTPTMALGQNGPTAKRRGAWRGGAMGEEAPQRGRRRWALCAGGSSGEAIGEERRHR